MKNSKILNASCLLIFVFVCSSLAEIATFNANTGIEDTFIDGYVGGQHDIWGDYRYLQCGNLSGYGEQKIILHFNVSGLIGKYKSVDSLQLRLYVAGGNPAYDQGIVNIGIYEICTADTDWLETTATWAYKEQLGNSGNDYAGSYSWVGSAGLGTSATDYVTDPLYAFDCNLITDVGFIDIDLPVSLIETWTKSTNAGLLIKCTILPDRDIAHFNSSECGSSYYGPNLLVTYTPLINTETITFDSQSGMEDVYIHEMYPTVNCNDSTRLWIGSYNDYDIKSLIKFDVRSLSDINDINISSAKLTLFYNDTPTIDVNFPIGIYKVLAANADWDQSTATWRNKNQTTSTPWAGSYGLNTPVTDYNIQSLGIFFYDHNKVYPSTVDVNIPAHVIKDWINNPNSNGGFLLKYLGNDPNAYAQFYDSLYASNIGPKLSITYTAPWQTKPIELLTGKAEAHTPQVTAANQSNFTGWTVSGTKSATGTLTNSSDLQLWRSTVAKLAITVPTSDSNITLTPPSPGISISSGDNIDIWVYGPSYGSPTISMNLTSGGSPFTVTMVGNVSNYLGNPWWTMFHGKIPAGKTFPVKLVSIAFDNLTNGSDVLYWDAISFYTDTTSPANPSLGTLSFPTTTDTILPSINAGTSYTNSVQVVDSNTWNFKYVGSDCNVTYTYHAATGTLNDITGNYNDVYTFYPTINGGIVANVGGESFTPDSPGTPQLLSSTLVSGDNYLYTWWQLTKNGQTIQYDLTFQIKGKTLVIRARNPDKNVITEFRIGRTSTSADYKLFPMPFWENRQAERPQILMMTGGLFFTAMLDWYETLASRFMFDSSPRDGTGTVMVSNKAYYGYPKTDGTLNPIRERLLITVSDKIAEVLPNIPNPPSPNGSTTSNLLYVCRDFCLLDPLDIDYEIALWQLLKAYGVNDMLIHFTPDMFKTPVANMNGFSLTTDAGLPFGGDDAVIRLVDELQTLGYKFGVYTDYRIIHPLSKEFSNDLVALDRGDHNSDWLTACGSTFMLKPSIASTKAANWDDGLVTKFGFDAVYSDEMTNTAPWGGLIDYDARVSGAGQISATFNAIGKVLLNQRDSYGLTWSEGTVQYLWAGLCDTAYSQNNHPFDDPNLLVDFKLLKMQPLENDNGVDLIQPYDKGLDWRLATQIVFGNMGYLSSTGIEGDLTMKQAKKISSSLYEPILKSYYMMRQLQTYYWMSLPTLIQYPDNTETLVSTEWAVRNNWICGKVYTQYQSGLEVYVNRNSTSNWNVSLGGTSYTLDPNGYVAYRPADMLEYSSLVSGHRVDYSEGPMYIYCNGRGTSTSFPKITAARSYAVTNDATYTWLTPTPFIATEQVTLKGYTSITGVTGFDQFGNSLPNSITYSINSNNLLLTTQSDVFKYRIQASDPGLAISPNPSNSATGVALTPTLTWASGNNTVSHDVYFGTNQTSVTNAARYSAEFKGNQAGTSYASGTLNANTIYYWRIDEVGNGKTTTGAVWSFTTIPPNPPTFVAAGAAAHNTVGITPALPAGIATNDILLLFVETYNQAISIANQNGGTWTQVTNSPQGTTGTRLTAFWSRYNGTQGAPTTSDSGDHQIGRIIAIQGATTSGNPCDVTAGVVESTSDTSGSIPGTTTTVANTLVVLAVATSLPDSNYDNNRFSSWTNANLTSLTERVDCSRNSGNGGGLGIATGIKVTSGAYGNTAVTLATSATKGMMSIAIKP
ncbi:MAG: hypothetical protein A2Y10_01230 [Planctomycetes bacterium GWF2_41_51]|nr:MAG: hypothetical protein A2Y10_01230 [Planctomycetes bacterium GWF2_41_51]HBG25625.1 hypothetical protein [Phycisphaerales bacterium]